MLFPLSVLTVARALPDGYAFQVPAELAGTAERVFPDDLVAVLSGRAETTAVDDEIIAEIGPRNLVPPGVVKGERDQPEHAAMARHSAFPNPKN